MKKTGKESLADRIAGVLTAAPTSFDPEDEETNAQVTENNLEQNDSEDDEVLLSKFRKQNIDLLEDVDTRYAGKKGSRRDIKDSDEESTENSDGVDSDGHENSESDDDEDNSDDDIENADNSREESDDNVSVDDGTFKHMKDPDTSGQVQKGICIKNQLNLWETFLETRIQLQKCLITSNKMPQHDTVQLFNEHEEFVKKTNETKKVVSSVLDKLLELQNVLVRKYPETKNIFKSGTKVSTEDDDEEIPSDTEEESSEGEEEMASPKKKMKISDYETDISNVHKIYTPFRNTVIQKWNDKTRIGTGKTASGHSVLNQIEHNLCDREKLIKRTQVKRSDYKILGAKLEEAVDPENAPRFVEKYNNEIYDDDDFYHQLLRELIEVKSADLTDPVQLGRQWIQLQNLRSKMKRKIDTRATKGRKIRYAVHTKLVNFMAPIDEHNYTDDAKTELFNSLFGKKQIVPA